MHVQLHRLPPPSNPSNCCSSSDYEIVLDYELSGKQLILSGRFSPDSETFTITSNRANRKLLQLPQSWCRPTKFFALPWPMPCSASARVSPSLVLRTFLTFSRIPMCVCFCPVCTSAGSPASTVVEITVDGDVKTFNADAFLTALATVVRTRTMPHNN